MLLTDALQYATWVVFLSLFVLTGLRALRRPLPVHVDTALVFASVGAVIGLGIATRLGLVRPGQVTTGITLVAFLLLALLQLRLLDHFRGVSRPFIWAAAAVFVVLAVAGFAFPSPLPPALLYAVLAYFCIVQLAASLGFALATRHTSGIASRRLWLAASGGGLLAAAIASVTLQPLLGAMAPLLLNVLGLASGLSFFLAFAPPRWVRRWWQAPELRRLLLRSARLSRLPTAEPILTEVAAGAAEALAAEQWAAALWDESADKLRFLRHPLFPTPGLPGSEVAADHLNEFLTGRAFLEQHAVASLNTIDDFPARAADYRSAGIASALAAPVTAIGETGTRRRFGVITVYGRRAPFFVEDDLDLLTLFAEQAAIKLEGRALLDETLRLRAIQQSAEIKQDFLSSAAHDLKTPITVLIGQTQILRRRLDRSPTTPMDPGSLSRLEDSARTLDRLVKRLLETARGDVPPLNLQTCDLAAAVRDACDRATRLGEHIRFAVETPAALPARCDSERLDQLLDNLLENAVKYTPTGGDVHVTLSRDDVARVPSGAATGNGSASSPTVAGPTAAALRGPVAHLTVADHGIGIPTSELPRIFERFHRAANVDDRRFSGMGLGLFTCRQIAELHGGAIWAESPGPDQGSRFHVLLPLEAAPIPPSPDGSPHGDGASAPPSTTIQRPQGAPQ